MKKRILSLVLGLTCLVTTLTGCSNNTGTENDDTPSSSDHPVITMNAPYRNMSVFYDLVHEKYPEINLEIIPYNGQNTSAYMKAMRASGQLTDIYTTTYYTPGRYDDENDFLDISGYDFTDNYTQSRLREVAYNGGIYMLPTTYNAIGITYNQTLLEKNGWTLPTNLDELAELKEKVEAAGYVFSRCQLELPGYGFQYLCDVAETGFLSTIDGIKWQNDFINGETTVSDTPEMLEALRVLDRWRDIGMLNADGTPDSDSSTKKFVAEGNTLFLVGNSNDLIAKTETTDTYRLMPYLSEDGTQNIFLLNVGRFVGLNKRLGDEGNEQKLEDAVHVMEVISTVEGMQSLNPSQTNSLLLPLKDWSIGEDSYYADVIDDLNNGHTASFIYSGWENIVVPLGEKMIEYIRGDTDLDDVIKCFDENQHLITEDATVYYTNVTETIDTENCAKLIGIAFAEAVGADAALVSVNEWKYNPDSKYMNNHGISGCLYPLPVSDEEIVSILPTGWRNNIQTVTLTGKQIKELAEYGDDEYGNGDTFPFVLVTKGGMELDDDTSYTIPYCARIDDEQMEEYNYQDSGVLGLDAVREYLGGFDTLSAADINWQ